VYNIEGVERIRLGSIEPTTITDKFIEMAVSCEKLCPHYHISLQSGCDETLKRMNRKYDTDKYREVVALLRNNIKDVALTTDVMVGFPGETEIEFEKTLDFLKEINFAKLHVFKYSPRKGTPAAAFDNQISPEVKEARSSILLKLSDKCTNTFNKSFEGRIMSVLYEHEVKGKPGFIEGITSNYIRVVSRGDGQNIAKIVDTRINEAIDDYTLGEIL
jgi:threonylcarbamoyladenosine tRNA methylthiotransferase MtaB